MRIEYKEVSLEAVLDYYANGFTPGKGEVVVSHSAVTDTAKSVVIFKLVIDEQPCGGVIPGKIL